jgi:hypothetical protein
MNNKWLILINPVIALMMLSQAVTSLNYYFAFIDRKTFLTLHMYGGYILTVFILTHLIINWFWVKNTFVKKKKTARVSPAAKSVSVQKKEETSPQEKPVQKENPS